jgi:hypothetical protein
MESSQASYFYINAHVFEQKNAATTNNNTNQNIEFHQKSTKGNPLPKKNGTSFLNSILGFFSEILPFFSCWPYHRHKN